MAILAMTLHARDPHESGSVESEICSILRTPIELQLEKAGVRLAYLLDANLILNAGGAH